MGVAFGGTDDVARGDPELIGLLVSDIAEIANLAHDARLAVMRAGGEATTINWQGKAAENFHKAFGPIAPDLGLMAESYGHVVDSLSRYSSELARIRTEVAYALNRARVAAQRKEVTDGQITSLQATLRRLTQQLSVVKSQGRAKTVEASLYTNDPVTAAKNQADLEAVRSTQRLLEQSIDSNLTDERRLSRESADAGAELNGANSDLHALQDEYNSAGAIAADAIRAALEQGLKNRSNFQRALAAGEHLANDAIDLVGTVIKLDLDAIAVIGKVLKDLDKIISKLQLLIIIAVVIIAIVTVIATGGVAGIAWAEPIMMLLSTVKLGVDASEVATDATLATAGEFGYRDPDGKRVGWSHVGWDAVETGSDAITYGEPEGFEGDEAQSAFAQGLKNWKDDPSDSLGLAKTIKGFGWPADPPYPPVAHDIRLLNKAHTWAVRAGKAEGFARKEYDEHFAHDTSNSQRTELGCGGGYPVAQPAFAGGGGGGGTWN